MKEVADKIHKDNSAGVVGLVLGVLATISGVPGLLLGFVGFWFSLYQYRHGKNKWAKWGAALNIIGFVIGVSLAIYIGFFVASNVSNLQALSELRNYG
jgi:ABC-type phosphate/phosphonate transport system permease subunit